MDDESTEAAEIARLAHLARSFALSADLQAERAAAEASQARTWRREAQLLRASAFWRLTSPARLALDVVRGRAPLGLPVRQGLARARAIAAEEGWPAAVRRARAWLGRQRPSKAALLAAPIAGSAEEPAYRSPLTEAPGRLLVPRVLIIAELTLPQCAKYRVWQKQEHIRSLGINCDVVNWHDTAACRTAASLATAAILYRVPGFPPVMEMIDELKRLQLPLWWEVDDLIFDEAQYLRNRNLAKLDKALRDSILSGVPLYRRAMLACGRGIASTERLAIAMREAGLQDVCVIENALDTESLRLADELRASPPAAHDGIVITYGSGTRTHDADFAIAAPALRAVLRDRAHARLRIVGDLALPDSFGEFAGRVEQLPKVPYAAYLRTLAASDISIAPLEDTVFNDAKSNIKFLEAAILGLPSVCSPRKTFTDIVEHGANGMLASETADWQTCLLALIDDAGSRGRIGEAARRIALERYGPHSIARQQVAPLFAGLPSRQDTRLRVLSANIYFWPKSFGGATIVAEEMARRLHARQDTSVYIVTGLETAPTPDTAADPAILRYEMPVQDQPPMMIAALTLPEPDPILPFDNPAVGRHFGHVLDAVTPHVVHLHSVQGLSAAIARACMERRIPYVITLHDAWWLCERQFMVMENGRYCFQTHIDLRLCEACVPGVSHLRQRFALLMAALRGAALLLSPSESHRRLYIAQGLDPGRIVVAPNGVRLPASPAASRPLRAGELTFAYVGGAVNVKGFDVVKKSFEALNRMDWRLILVDNTMNLGFSSIDARGWHLTGAVEIVPAYTQATMDAFFAGIDVLVFPSQWKESFGLTVREALLRGVWVIATEGGGPAEAIDDGVNGTLIPLDGQQGSTDALLLALNALLDHPEVLTTAHSPPRQIIDFAAQAETLHRLLKQAAGQTSQKEAA